MLQKVNLTVGILALLGIIYVISTGNISSEKVAYVETRKLVESHKNMKEITARFQAKIAELQGRMETLNREMEAEVKKYEEERDNMSYEDRSRREQQISKKQQEMAQYYQTVQQQTKLEDDEQMQALVTEINGFILEYGKKHNYKMIIAANGNNLAYADKSLDITDDLIAALNNQ